MSGLCRCHKPTRQTCVRKIPGRLLRRLRALFHPRVSSAGLVEINKPCLLIVAPPPSSPPPDTPFFTQPSLPLTYRVPSIERCLSSILAHITTPNQTTTISIRQVYCQHNLLFHVRAQFCSCPSLH